MLHQESWQLEHEAAAAYERDFVPAIFAQWPPVLAELTGMRPGERVLDVGCGTGILAREALARVGPTGHVTGLDLNEGMLAVARRLRPEIDWRQGDALDLPFADGAFDAVVSQFALMFFADRAAALGEMWRVLAPRGRLALAVCAPLVRGDRYSVFADILRREVGEQAAGMVESYFAFGDAADLTRLCQAAGIAGARVLSREGRAHFASIDELVRIEVRGSPLSGLVGEAQYRNVLAAARRDLRDACDAGGRVSLRLDATIVTAAKP